MKLKIIFHLFGKVENYRLYLHIIICKDIEMKVTERIKNEINSKIQTGDYNTLSKVLNVGYQTAFSRYSRGEPFTVELMQKIINSREELIKKLKIQFKKKRELLQELP